MSPVHAGMTFCNATIEKFHAVAPVNYTDLGWESKRVDTEPAGTRFNHANFSGELNGAGQTGHAGEAIWMTSGNHTDAARGYLISDEVQQAHPLSQ